MTTAHRHVGSSCNSQRVIDALAPAKVNLFLEVLGKRPDGFHELQTVMAAVNWYDRLRFVARDDDRIQIHMVNPGRTNLDQLPVEQNLIYRALKRLQPKIGSNCLPGCDVFLYKEVPIEAGLGGASSDAAVSLQAGNLLWNLNLPNSELHDLAAELGSDVPFFIYGGTAVCRGRGEQVQPLASRGGIPLVIVKPPVGLSTRRVFERLQISGETQSLERFLNAFATGDVLKIGQSLFNRLSETALTLNEQIRDVANRFALTNAIGQQMSGSGSAYFGLFESMRRARLAARRISMQLPLARVFVGQTLGLNKSCLSPKEKLFGRNPAKEMQHGNH